MSKDKSFLQLCEEFKDDPDFKQQRCNYKKANQVKVKPIDWLWKNRIPSGKITIFAGEGGLGKSTLLFYLAALISKGGYFKPDECQFSQGNVIILSAEDDEDDVIVPRLKAVDANLDAIFFLYGDKELDADGKEYTGTLNLDVSISKINKAITEIKNVKLLIIDPISAFLGDVKDSSNSEVRLLLTRLTNMAREHGMAIILNTHTTKPKSHTSESASNRVMGSVAYVNASRATYLISRDPNDPNVKRLLLPIKNNYGDDIDGFSYQIKIKNIEYDANGIIQEMPATYVEFSNEKIQVRADDVIGTNKEDSSKLEMAINFLESFLEFGCKPVYEIIKKAQEQDISSASIYRAKLKLKLVEERSIANRSKKVWFFPPGDIRDE